jgi:hypothetical protein
MYSKASIQRKQWTQARWAPGLPERWGLSSQDSDHSGTASQELVDVTNPPAMSRAHVAVAVMTA